VIGDQVGLYISLRMTLLETISRRLLANMRALDAEIVRSRRPEHEFLPGKPGISLRVDNELKYQVIADLHAYVTELDACMDQLKGFMEAVYAYAGRPISDIQRKAIINGWMQKRGIDPAWVRSLARCRNFVAHVGPLYLAVDVSRPNADLLLLKENVAMPTPTQCFRLSELLKVRKGFRACKEAMQGDLVQVLA